MPSPSVDAELLLAHVLRISRGELQAQVLLGQQADADQLKEYAETIALRAERVPLQHITGTVSFCNMNLAVGPGVFIPRPETEYLVELVRLNEAHRIDQLFSNSSIVKFLDLGTGSGAIAAALHRWRPTAQVTAVELDPKAAEWAFRNFEANAPEVCLEVGDMAGILARTNESYDLIVSNPPYIPAESVPNEPEVYLHDPELALYSGADGLDAIRQIANLARGRMNSGGKLWLEHADGQSPAIVELLLAQGWVNVRAWRDLTERLRYISASFD